MKVSDMEPKLVYDTTMTVGQLLEHIELGKTVYCPRCLSELIAALDDETIARLQVHCGIYCSKDTSHVAVYVDLKPREGFWEQFKSG